MGYRGPVYVRAPDYRYCLRSESGYGWLTGVIDNNRQVLLFFGVWFEFDRKGQFIATHDFHVEQTDTIEQVLFRFQNQEFVSSDGRMQGVVFEECPIFIQRFWMPNPRVGISDLPYGLKDDYLNRDSFSEKEREVMLANVLEWVEVEYYAFSTGGGETYIAKNGDCLASPA